MGLSINNSISSIFAQRQASLASGRIARNLGQLASGLRINRAADDAAGLAIAEGFRAEIRQLNQEVGNLQTGLNLASTAEGALEAQSDQVGRIRELAVQASSGVLNDEQRQALNAEAQQLLAEIDDTAARTDFNGIPLLDASAGTIDLGTEGTAEINLSESTVDSLDLNGLDLTTQAGASNALTALDTAANRISENRASLGAQGNRITSSIQVRTEEALNLQQSESAIRDLDLAQAVIEQNRNDILLRSALGAITQGNLQNETALTLLGG